MVGVDCVYKCHRAFRNHCAVSRDKWETDYREHSWRRRISRQVCLVYLAEHLQPLGAVPPAATRGQHSTKKAVLPDRGSVTVSSECQGWVVVLGFVLKQCGSRDKLKARQASTKPVWKASCEGNTSQTWSRSLTRGLTVPPQQSLATWGYWAEKGCAVSLKYTVD